MRTLRACSHLPIRVAIAIGGTALLACVARAAVVPVASTAQLIAAIDGAQPGDAITLAPGAYTVSQNLLCDTAGTPDASIAVRAAQLGTVLLRFDAVEGFKVSAPYWTFENLEIEGICADDSDCEHAFHLFDDAEWTVIRHNRVRDFNAQVKSNGAGPAGAYRFPDDVLVEGNHFHDTAARATGNPVTKIDVVGGRRWVVRSNLIHDFEKGGGDHVSYAAFLKGNSRDGVFERNLVVCARDFSGGTRLGLSLGGGGTGPDSICESATCTPEHQNGTLRNNLVLACNDVGIYLNEAAGTALYANTLYATAGIDVRFPASSAVARHNVLTGTIDIRDGATLTKSHNLESVSAATFDAWFADPAGADFTLVDGTALVGQATPPPTVAADYCGLSRGAAPHDLGAVEYPTPAPCDTTLAGGGTDVFHDGFERGGTGAWSGRSNG